MNEIKLANILIRKRREKGITQEELAAYVGVSKAAVSKWEKEQSYPDIALLPQLAAYFNISVDELLGYTPQLTREDTWKMCRKISADFTFGPFDEVMAEIRAVTKKYYSCFPFLYQMAVLLVNHYTIAGSEEKQAEVIEEAKALCKRVVSESRDALLAKDALYTQCLCCIVLQAPDEVFALLGESLQAPEMTEDSLIAQAYELAGNTAKAREITQCGIYRYLMYLVEAILNYVLLTGETLDTAETAFDRTMKIIRMFNMEKLNANTAAKAYLAGANLYCKHGCLDKSLEMLEKYADLCVTTFLPFKLRGDFFFTDIDEWLNSGILGSSPQYDTKMIKQNMLQSLSAFPSLSALHDEPRYKSIVKRITEYTNAQ